jgi:Uma2 family endonuclease
MSAQPESFLTAQDYLVWERQQETRHEYLEGQVFAMTGASRAHNVLCMNLSASLHQQLRGKPCEIYANDMRVKVSETGMYTYPDLVAACGEPRFEDQAVDTLLNPVLIIEVLSDSTERYDRGAKFTHYRSVVSLREYLLVSQHESRVEHYVRQPGNHWLLTEYQEMQDRIDLNSLDSYLSLAEVYERIFTLPKP